MDTTNRYQVIDAATGQHTRAATESEAQMCKAAGDELVRLSATESVYLYTGPGVWFGGAGF